MLVISRKVNETLVIGDNVVVTVVDLRADKVRLGVMLPREMALHRGEVYQAIHGVPPTAMPAPVPPAPVPPVKVHTPAAVPADVVAKHLDAIRKALHAAAADGVHVEIVPANAR